MSTQGRAKREGMCRCVSEFIRREVHQRKKKEKKYIYLYIYVQMSTLLLRHPVVARHKRAAFASFREKTEKKHFLDAIMLERATVPDPEIPS